MICYDSLIIASRGWWLYLVGLLLGCLLVRFFIAYLRFRLWGCVLGCFVFYFRVLFAALMLLFVYIVACVIVVLIA